MALPNISSTDFVGPLKIVANEFKSVDLDQYADTYTEEYLNRILGEAAVIDIAAQTLTKWTDILDGVDYVDVNGKRRRFEGLVKSLLNFIYFEFIRDSATPTQAGKMKAKASNSERASGAYLYNLCILKYNTGVRIVNTLSDFLEANERIEENITTSVDNADGTYTIGLPSTRYLSTEENIIIGGSSYEVTAVTADTNATIDVGTTGLDFAGDPTYWEPFGEVEFCKMKYATL